MRKHSKETRKYIHKILVAAVPHLAHNRREINWQKSLFICYAIDSIRGRMYHLACYADEAKAIIQKRLGIHCSVYGYLRYELRVPREQLTDKNIQDFRHRWLQELIREFSE